MPVGENEEGKGGGSQQVFAHWSSAAATAQTGNEQGVSPELVSMPTSRMSQKKRRQQKYERTSAATAKRKGLKGLTGGLSAREGFLR